ncbi:MAG: sigma-54 dependent transcriptional regulator [Phycisphaerales bacterium]|nr:sigma-54 dependent transcriptional regulator [Phycisphaerales bacterium]
MSEIHAQILIVDDEPDHAEVMAESLSRLGHVCTVVEGFEKAKDELLMGSFDVIVTDMVMEEEQSGLEVLKLANEHQDGAATIVVTAHGDIPTAKAALQGGAYDFIEKPLDLDVFRNLVNRAAESVLLKQQNEALKGQVDAAYGFEGIIGDSPAIRKVIEMIRRVAPSNLPVLITGDSGTGKELVAQAIHNQSKRVDKKYVAFNCAGQSESLLEDQLFGHVRGAFTGADRDREGVFEFANSGTLFLDEIGDMPIAMQAKLLRVLETGDVVRLGQNSDRKVDVRFVSATNQNLQERCESGDFREDLYFRIKGAEIYVPPLRERREDIPMLIQFALGKYAADMDCPRPPITDPAVMRLVSYDWPGNVRELLNVVQRMAVMAENNTIDITHVPDEVKATESEETHEVGSLAGIGLDRLEKEAIRQTLALTGGNREQTAKMLGIGERTLYRKLKEYGIK